MELAEDELNKKCDNNCGYCSRNNPLPYEYERNCVSCGYNVNKRKHELTKIQGKEQNLSID